MNSKSASEQLRKSIRSIPDFPKPGIMFRDITTLLKDPAMLELTVDMIAEHFSDTKIDKIAGIESRGFIFGAPLATKLKKGFVPLRKKGKLPAATHGVTYDLEYGQDTIEIHQDAFQPGDRVLVVDDLLATGGTLKAALKLVEKAGGVVAGCAFLVELTFLNPRKNFADYEMLSLVEYDSEEV